MFLQDQHRAVLLAREEGIEQGIEKVAIRLLDIMDEQAIAQATDLPLSRILWCVS